MTRLAAILLVVAALIATVACGSSGVSVSSSKTAAGDKSQALSSGNWVIATQSKVNPDLVTDLGGSFTGSGTSASAALLSSSLCTQNWVPAPPPLYEIATATSFSSVSASAVTPCTPNGTDNFFLQSAAGTKIDGTPTATMCISATLNNGSNLTGSYVLTGGGTACDGDKGGVYGTLVPPLTGTWTGNLNNIANNGTGPTGDVVAFSASLQQSATANPDGTSPLSGTITLQVTAIDPTNQQALATYYTAGGQIDSTQSFVRGDSVTIVTIGATLSFQGTIANPALAQQIQNLSLTPGAYNSDPVFMFNLAQGTVNKS